MSALSRKLPRVQGDTRSDRIAIMIVAAGASLWCVSRAAADCRHELLGRWGGECNAVATDGTTAYTGIGSTLMAVDIADPTHPIERGRLMLGGPIVQMQLTDNLLFAACDYGGLQIVDVSNPDHPARVGEYSGGVYAVTVRDSRAYILTEYFSVLDVSDPASPVLLGQGAEYVLGGFNFQDVALSGKFAFVSGYYEGLLVYDVSDPSAPQRIATHDVNPGLEVMDLETHGNLLYAGAWYDRLLIFDVSDVLAPQLVSCTHLGELDLNFLPYRLTVQDDRAFVAGGDGLAVLDVSDPSAPVTLSSVFLDHVGHDVCIFDQGVAVAAGRAGLVTCQLLPNGQWNRVGRLDEAGWIYAAAADSGVAYVDRLLNDAAILDFRDPARPRLVRSLPQLRGNSAAIVGERLYAGGGGLGIYDLSNPETPAQLGFIDTPMFIRWVEVGEPFGEPFVFVAGDRDSLGHDAAIIDASYPDAPQLVSLIQAHDQVEAARLNGNTWFLSTRSGLQVIDVADPASPESLGVFPNIRFRDIAFSGGIAFLAAGYMQTVDVSDPSKPTVLLTWPAEVGRVDRIALAGAYLFGGKQVNSGGATLFQVADPLDPRILVRYDELSGPWSVVDNLAVVADTHRGMSILRIGQQADLNLDARVDLDDLATLLAHFGTAGSARRPDGDLDGDADVDMTDLLEVLGHYGAVCD